jgi:L-lactate utilization protein LutB/heterodisulfide reductase subunit B
MVDDDRVRKAVVESPSLDGMRRSFETILARQRQNASLMPDLEARKERLRRVKESSVCDDELLVKAIASLEGNGFKVILAKTAEAAVEAVRAQIAGNDLVVKSKSNVSKELHLADELARDGVEVVETDLGDRIIQLAGGPASHPTGPACHMTRGEIAELFSEHFSRAVSDDPAELTAVMREEIASYMDRARVGITGANAIAALEGSVVIVHNEGNAARCASLPDKHIIVTTPDKIVPDLEECLNIVRLQTYLSTGKIVSSYINIISGESYTADIEKQVYRGMHGPKQVVVILVDDGRLYAEDREPQFCIGCGMCLLHCPVYNVLGPVFGTSGHTGGQGVYLAGATGRLDESVEGGLYLCTSCGMCEEVCPSRIDVKTGLWSIREETFKLGKGQHESHSYLASSIRNYGNPWQVPRSRKARWSRDLGLPAKGEVLYFSGCSTPLIHPEVAEGVVRILRHIGIDPAYLGKDEGCCGSVLRKLGRTDLAREMVEACFEDFKRSGAKVVVTSCPGCSSALNRFEDIRSRYGIPVVHIAEFLDGRLDAGSFSPPTDPRDVVYHDPCDLGREQGVYDAPRRLIEAALGKAPLEMARTCETSACCGSGSGVKSAYPELATAIAKERVRMACETGSTTIVTCCPWCEQGLKECQGPEDREVEVIDIVELILESLGLGDARK